MIEGAEKLAVFANALGRGELSLTSAAATLQSSLGVPHSRLQAYRDVLLAARDRQQLTVALGTAAETVARLIGAEPRVEVVWTYPGQSTPGFRTTGGVVREIIDASRQSILLVGYRVTVDPGLTGLAAQSLDSIARAAERGVKVTAVLHQEANRGALLDLWRPGVQPPSIFTWPLSNDEKASVHAKLVIADRRDGLITSANLTYHGFEGNLEMGVRITGHPIGEIQDRIYALIAEGELVPWRS